MKQGDKIYGTTLKQPAKRYWRRSGEEFIYKVTPSTKKQEKISRNLGTKEWELNWKIHQKT